MWHRPAQTVTWEYFLITKKKKISKTGNDTWHLLSYHHLFFKSILFRKHLAFTVCICWYEVPFPGFSRTNSSTICSFSTSEFPQNSTLIKFLLFPSKHNAWKLFKGRKKTIIPTSVLTSVPLFYLLQLKGKKMILKMLGFFHEIPNRPKSNIEKIS